MVISMPTMVEEAIKDSDEVEILESLHVSPAPVNTTYGNLPEPTNMYKVSGSLEIVSSSILRIYRNCKTIGVNSTGSQGSRLHSYGPSPKGNFLA